jgi:PAS domain S-box-containing protein
VSEEKYRVVSEMAKDGIAIVQNNRLVYVNPSLARIGGYSVEELTGASFIRFVAPESVVDLLSIIKNALLGKPVPEFFTTRIRHRDGHTIEIEANGTTIIWEGKKALLGIVRDITERRQAEKALQESQDLYQTLAESSPDMIYLIDREGYIRYVNSNAARQFSRSPRELMGKRVDDLFPADIARNHMAGITRTITTGQPQFSEIFESFPTQDYWINARLNPVKDSKGVVTHVLGISTDITEHKRAEQVLEEEEAKLRTIFESIQAGIVIIS